MKFVFNRLTGIEIVAGRAAIRFNGSECTTRIDESEAKFLRDALLQAYPIPQAAPSDAACDRIGKLAAELAETKEEARQARNLNVSAQAELAKVRRELHTAQTTALQATEAAQALNEYNANLAERLKVTEAKVAQFDSDMARLMYRANRVGRARVALGRANGEVARICACDELVRCGVALQDTVNDITRRMGTVQNAANGEQS